MVNYERVPWDKSNPLQVRLVNQALAEIQRKATFIDTILHAPRIVTWLVWGSATKYLNAMWWILHPAYPILTAFFLDENPDLSIPPNELDPDDGIMIGNADYKSRIYETFDWSTAPMIEISLRDGDSVWGAQHRWLKNQYRGVRGQSQLLPIATKIGTTTVTNDECSAISLLKGNGETRPELNYNLDDLWSYFKYLLGRDLESYPQDVYYTPPSEADNLDHDQMFEPYEPVDARSQAVWPELRGYYTGYIDNLAIFLPLGYELDAIVTMQVYDQLVADGYNTFQMEKMVVLTDELTTDNLQGSQLKDFTEALQTTPLVGGWIGSGVKFGRWVDKGFNHRRRFWPKIYAFGRQPYPVLSYQHCRDFHQFYYERYQAKYKGPVIDGVEKHKVENLITQLVDKRYLSSDKVGGWI